MQFIIKIKDIKFNAKNIEEAENIAIDIVNDIGHDGNYELSANIKK